MHVRASARATWFHGVKSNGRVCSFSLESNQVGTGNNLSKCLMNLVSLRGSGKVTASFSFRAQRWCWAGGDWRTKTMYYAIPFQRENDIEISEIPRTTKRLLPLYKSISLCLTTWSSSCSCLQRYSNASSYCTSLHKSTPFTTAI